MSNIGKNLFVTGIDTGVGKTVVAAIFAQALQADYWKPIQCGDLDQSDRQSVTALVSFAGFKSHPEAYRLQQSKSPHQAAAWEGMTIDLEGIKLPQTSNRLVVEGAGGVLVPLNDTEWIVDIARKFELSTVVVTKNYLGSLNHSFLTIEALRRRGVDLAGLVFNGPKNRELEEFVAARSDLPILLQVREEGQLNQQIIASYAEQLKEKI